MPINPTEIRNSWDTVRFLSSVLLFGVVGMVSSVGHDRNAWASAGDQTVNSPAEIQPQCAPVVSPVKKPSKSGYNLFHPTPRALMRDFSADRPGSTSTPITVDAGHYQLELELINYSRLTADGVTSSQVNYPNPALRIGLLNNLEFEVAWIPRLSQNISVSGGPGQTISGMGDVNLHFRVNMYGNEGGSFAWAIMPGVKAPTNTNGLGNPAWEPNLMVPLAFALPGDWGLSITPELDFRKDTSDDALHTEVNWPINLGHHLFGVFDGYVEFVSHSSNEDGSHMNMYLGTGIAAMINANMQLDAGGDFGLNSVSAPFEVFAGWTYRY